LSSLIPIDGSESNGILCPGFTNKEHFDHVRNGPCSFGTHERG